MRHYPNYETPPALQLCAPRPEAGPVLEAALRPVVARAAARVARGKVVGLIDGAGPQRVEGWAHDVVNPDPPVLLGIYAGDDVVGTVLACDYRADLADAGFGGGRCAFSVALPRVPGGALRMKCLATGTALNMTEACRAA